MKRGANKAAGSATVLLSVFVLDGCLFSVTPYAGPSMEHFDGARFYNQEKGPEHGFVDFLRFAANRERGPWQGVVGSTPGPPPPRQVGKGELRLTVVNHSTVLIQIDGINLLTDPVWSERASPVDFAGPRRFRAPGLRFEDLPPIDVVLISHNHYDHLDVPTLRTLQKRHDPIVLTGLGNSKFLRREGVGRAVDMDWWQQFRLGGELLITFVPARHFSGRGLFDRYTTLWGGFVVQAVGTSVYFAGDTGFGQHFRQIRERFGPPTVALLPIGAYKPRWFMAPYHISPEEAVLVHRLLGARTSIPVHHSTFALGDDGEQEPLEDLRRALAASGQTEAGWWILPFGEGRGPETAPEIL